MPIDEKAVGHVRLPKRFSEDLKALAEETRRSVTAEVAVAIEAHLTQNAAAVRRGYRKLQQKGNQHHATQSGST